MMDSIALREFLQKKYENPTAFLENVIYPVFGEENYDSSGSYHWLRKHPEDQIAAENSGILDILVLGSLFVEGSQLDIFDVTVSSKHQLANNRVGIQQLIRRIISTHSGAFIIFHYKTSVHWDWRFTFCHKGASQLDSTDAKRYTFLLGPGQSCRTAADNFCKLGQVIATTGSFTMEDVIDAFDVEALSLEFFGKYKAQYEKFVSYMADEENGMREDFIDTDFVHDGLTDEEICSREEKPLRDYVKKLLGRIVFLYFIQKKGWLGVEPGKDWGEGDMEFMLHLFEKASKKQRDNFLDEVLEPLFEDGLNTDRSSNNHLFDTGVKGLPNNGILKVPYLNGGLFERDATDEPKSVFPAEYFDSLLTFLSQYNFTIDENDPNDAQVGIDPEMLGRIFENLLEDNKDKGTFYTPKEIVQYMCRESLIAYLQREKSDVEKQIIRDFVLSYDTKPLTDSLRSEIDGKLKSVKVCDPAIGSGAFPMGILKEIFYCRGAIENFADAARIKKEIINNNLYGVDIEKGAVDIARLRFWLAIVVDETNPTALPNLDYKVMQGNSLLESYKKVDLSHLMEDETFDDGSRQLSFYDDVIEDTREELTVLQSNYFDCSDHEEKRHIEEDIKTVINTQLSAQRISIDLSEIENIAANQDFFLWHTWFADVFSGTSDRDKGFDIVIGNPPYGANIDALVKEYEKRYPNTSHGFKDIYKYFFDRGLELCHKDAVLCYITPNTYLRQPRYGDLRRVILKTDILQVLNLGEKIFEEAVVPVAITLLLNTSGDSSDVLFVDLTREINVSNAGALLSNVNFKRLPQSAWDKTINNSFIEDIRETQDNEVILDEILSFKDAGINYQRVNVGLSQKGKSDLSKRLMYEGEQENPSDVEFWKGVDINEFYIEPYTGRYCRTKIKTREGERVILNADYFAIKPKLIWRQTAPYPICTVDYQGLWFGRSIQAGLIKPEYKNLISYEYLCGVLNSSYIRSIYESNVKEGGRVFPQVKLEKLKPLPIVVPSKEQKALIESIVKSIMKIKKSGGDITSLKARLDEAVEALFK